MKQTDKSRREALIIEHLDVARRIARKIARRVPRSVSREELESAAMLGLTEAAARYDLARNEPFASFAAKRVRGAVLDDLRGRDALTRRRRKDARRLAHAARQVEAREGRPATTSELAATMGVSREEVVACEARSRAPRFVPIDDDSAPMQLASNPAVGEELDRRREQRALRAAMHRLPDRERRVVNMYYEGGLTQRQIGRSLGVTESRVSQLRSRAVKTLRALCHSGRGHA